MFGDAGVAADLFSPSAVDKLIYRVSHSLELVDLSERCLLGMLVIDSFGIEYGFSMLS